MLFTRAKLLLSTFQSKHSNENSNESSILGRANDDNIFIACFLYFPEFDYKSLNLSCMLNERFFFCNKGHLSHVTKRAC